MTINKEISDDKERNRLYYYKNRERVLARKKRLYQESKEKIVDVTGKPGLNDVVKNALKLTSLAFIPNEKRIVTGIFGA